MPSRRIVTSAESVTCGQSDKLCDIIIDTILDRVLDEDRFARVDLSAMAAPGLVLVAGEMSTKTYVDITGTVRGVLADVGYNNPAISFNAKSIAVLNILQEQSEEVALAVDKRGAGNQGIMIGYATNETKSLEIDTNLMPLPIHTAHQLAHRLTEVRNQNLVAGLLPDGQVHATFMYEGAVPVRLLVLAINSQHDVSVNREQFHQAIMETVIQPTLRALGQVDISRAELLINPAGAFTRGGPEADVGISGRNTVSDLYGTAVPCGGRSLSGKDPTKTDRAATYMARHVAKTVVAAHLAERCEVRLAYLFGREEPISVQINTFGSAVQGTDKQLADAIREVFDLTTAGIVEHLDLQRVRYAPFCCFGHVGRAEAPWETITQAERLAQAFNARKG